MSMSISLYRIRQEMGQHCLCHGPLIICSVTHLWRVTWAVWGCDFLFVCLSAKIGQHGGIPLLISMIRESRSKEETQAATKALYTLVFDEANRNCVCNDQDIMETVQLLQSSDDEDIRRPACGILWEVKGKRVADQQAGTEWAMAYADTSIHPSTNLSVCPSICLSTYLSLSPSIHLCLSVCLCVSISSYCYASLCIWFW